MARLGAPGRRRGSEQRQMANAMQGLYAIIPTPAKESASRLDVAGTVALDETESLVGNLIRDGVSGLVILGTTGECATLTRADYDAFTDCVLASAAARVPVWVGTTALGMHEIADRMRFARGLGAAGTLLGLPMWQPLTLDMAVSFYERLSAAFPDFPIMVYANKRAFRFDFGTEFWRQVSRRAPTVRAAKYSRPATLADHVAASDGRIQFVPHQTAAYEFARIAPENTTACWSTMASMGPEPALAVIDAILERDWDRAEAVAADLHDATDPVRYITDRPELFASYTIQIEKTRMKAARYCDPGPIRPPYDLMPREYVDAAEESAARWVRLRAKYATTDVSGR